MLFLNRPGVARAVFQTPLLFINSLTNWLILFLQIFKTSSLQIHMIYGSEIFRESSPPSMCQISHCKCHMSLAHVTCHMSHMACHMSHVTHIFCRVLKMKIIFLNFQSYHPPFAVRNSLTNQFYQKNLVSGYFHTKRDKFKYVHPGDSWPYGQESPGWISLFKLVI